MVVVYTSNQSLRGRNQQGVNVRPNQAGEFVAQGMQNLAAGIGSFAEAVAYRDEVKAEADARDAANKYRDIVRSGLYDPNTGYLTTSGSNAINGQRTDTHASLKEARNNINDSLSPRAQRTFSRMADDLDNSAKDSTIRHEAAQLREFTLQTFEASAQGLLDDALLEPFNEKKFNEKIDAAAVEIMRAAELKGTAGPAVQEQLDALTATAHAGRVIEMARTDPIAAYDYLEAKKDILTREDYNKLHSSLEPVMYAARARDWVSAQNVVAEEAGTTAEDVYGVPYWISGPESGGDSNAENPMPGQSATGRVQFIARTYLNYVDKLKPAWAEGLSDEEILETRRDPAKEGQIYRAFRADNQRTLKNAGFEVTPRNEYLAHHMGAGTAVKLLELEANGQGGMSLRAALNAMGQDGDYIVSVNPWMKGKTVTAAMRWFGSKTATKRTVANPTLLLKEALEIEDPKMREAALKELQQRISVEEAVRLEEQRVASDKAWSIVDEGGNPSDIPPDLQAEVGLSTMNDIFTAYENNQQGVDFTNEERHLELIDLMNEDPKAFINLDLNDERVNLSRGDLLALKDAQADLAGDIKLAATQGASAVVYTDEDYRKAMSDAKMQYQAAAGVAPGASMTTEQAAQYNRFTQQLRKSMKAFADEHGRQMSFEERVDAMNTLLMPTIIDGVDLKKGFGRGTFLADVPLLAREGFELQLERGDVPPDEERRIREDLEATFGRAPSDGEVVEQYENEVLLSLGIHPTMEYREIPKDIRRKLTDDNPGASDAEIVEMFIALSLQATLRGDPGMR